MWAEKDRAGGLCRIWFGVSLTKKQSGKHSRCGHHPHRLPKLPNAVTRSVRDCPAGSKEMSECILEAMGKAGSTPCEVGAVRQSTRWHDKTRLIPGRGRLSRWAIAFCATQLLVLAPSG